jgi:adenylate cyclase
MGAMDHYEYRPIGDIVNTATRVEGLNKYLGTRVLASEEVIHQLDGFLTREVGTFLLAGKSKPLGI